MGFSELYGIEVSAKDLIKKNILFSINGHFESHYVDSNLKEKMKKINKKIVVYSSSFDCDTMYVGMHWSKIKNNETGIQFKQRVEKCLKPIFGNNLIFKNCKEEW